MRYRWHLLAGSGIVAGMLALWRHAVGLPLTSDSFLLGAVVWVVGWAMLFTEGAVVLSQRFWWTGGAYSWLRYRGTAPQDRDASIRAGTRAIGGLMSLLGWALMAVELWRR